MSSSAKNVKKKTSGSSVSSPSCTPSQSTKFKFKTTDVSVNCGKCCGKVDDSSPSVECELCLKWHHVECTSLNKSDLGTLEKLGVHWYCSVCEQSCATLDKRIKAVEVKFEEFSKVQEGTARSYADVVSKIDTSVEINKSLQEQITKQITSLKTEQQQVTKQISTLKTDIQADNRSKNVVIFGLEENCETPLVDSLTELLNDCSMKIPIDKSSCYRLGQKSSSKSRPVKLMLPSEAEKWEVLRRINSIKPSGVFARKDLTKEEQEADFVLRQELKDTREKDPKNTYKIIRNKVTLVSK
jgi:hypothetical protein